jgi:hypothetical protein
MIIRHTGAEQEKKSRGVKLNNVMKWIFFLRLYFKGGAENFKGEAGENFSCRSPNSCQLPLASATEGTISNNPNIVLKYN